MHRVSYPSIVPVERAYRIAERAEFPIQYTNDSVFSRMIDKVVNLIVAVHNARAYLAFIWRVCLVPFDEVIEVRDVSHGFLRIDVDRLGLFARDVR